LIAIIDYNVGNVAAVANMFRRIGVETTITSNPDLISRADRIVLPGNGAFDTCMNNIQETGLIPLLHKRVIEDGVPLLGICVGAQMLGNTSEEGESAGLGWLNMEVNKFTPAAKFPVPNMGWRDVTKGRPHPLLEGLDGARFYFVHGYFMQPQSVEEVILSSTYGHKSNFAASVAKDNICGVQFHPEKSHRFGKQFLTNFSKWVP
jgi:glutamine amidotransferase